MSSHAVVARVRKKTHEKRVGHGGTLDPFAEGVLVVGVGRESTKKLSQILKGVDKEYLALIELGKTSTTGDSEGKLRQLALPESMLEITKAKTEEALSKFQGEIEQTPPSFSALKVKGVPAYRLARAGKVFTLPKRKVKIKELEILEFKPPFLKLRIVASSGTYIRTLAEDIGEELGVGAYLKELLRTRVGGFKIEDSQTLEEFSHV
ncbi:MAG: tRNA pseudouridine(55) synthase TruB [Candidatus Colwellbacteria bacterium]|nr:tRNA pseudouridine(55) synthase TruB [Candidatus Colwellbacteria bacterium]